MTRFTRASLCASLAAACGPEASNEPEPPGVLEYEHPYVRIYRVDRRVDILRSYEGAEGSECALLTERAYADLEDTLSALDPREDYGYDSETQECDIDPGSWIHIDGFEQSPFLCSWYCCHPELMWAGLIYSLVEGGRHSSSVIWEGERYVALEPHASCP